MSDKLKPCPLCGADAEMHYEKLCGTTIYMVKCSADKCQCQEMGWHETETDATNVWNTRPIDDALQARIAELEAENAIFREADYEALKNAEEKPIYCAKCRDGIVADDDGICGVCAGAQDGVIENLKKKVGEIARSAFVWHKYPDEKPELNVKCLVMFDDGEPIIDSFDGFYWFDIEKTWVDRITHWAYLPEPPMDEA